MSRDRLSLAESYAVLRLIEANGRQDNGYWIYNEGYDDERIARECNVPVTSVAYRRTEMFGQIRKSSGNTQVDSRLTAIEIQSQASRVDTHRLTKRVEALEKALNILLTGPNRAAVQPEKLAQLKEHFSGHVTPTKVPT